MQERDRERGEVATRIVRCGLGFRLLGFGMILVLSALLMIVLSQPFDAIMSQTGDMASTEASQTGHMWVQQMWDWIPYWVGMLGMISLLAGAVYESRGGRR